MSLTDIVARKNKSNVPVRRAETDNTLFSFQREINRMFNDFFQGGDLLPFRKLDENVTGAFVPKVDVSETKKEIMVSAELPGMDEKDIEVEFDNNNLTIRGEKKENHEEKGRNWRRIEQSYGSFQRVIPLPSIIVAGKTEANFRKGILTVTMEKAEEEANRKKIEVKAA